MDGKKKNGSYPFSVIIYQDAERKILHFATAAELYDATNTAVDNMQYSPSDVILPDGNVVDWSNWSHHHGD